MLPNAKMDVDQAGLDFITKWEGVVLNVYRDVAGKKTYGVGHLVRADEDADFPDGRPISMDFAMQTLRKDVQKVVGAIRKYVTVKLNQNQFNALASFLFNVGTGPLQNGSRVLDAVNAKNFSSVPDLLNEWVNVTVGGVKQVNQGLKNRRQSEGKLFMSPPSHEVIEDSLQAAAVAPSRPWFTTKEIVFLGTAVACSVSMYYFGWSDEILSFLRQGRKRTHASQR